MIKDKFILKDSGERSKYLTGAMRDSRFSKGRFDLISPIALIRIARVYEKGARKYTDRNWEKGLPFSRFIDSALRHIIQFMMGGEEDEDHLAQACWNLMAIMHMQMTHPGLNDLPQPSLSPTIPRDTGSVNEDL